MALKCNLPVERYDDVLVQSKYFNNDEETAIRQHFTQYLFYEGAKTRTVYCTACRQRGEMQRTKRPDVFMKKHGGTGSCPMCGETVEWRAIGRYQYNMTSLKERRSSQRIYRSMLCIRRSTPWPS